MTPADLLQQEITAELLADAGTAIRNVITSFIPGAKVNVEVRAQPKLGLWIEIDQAEAYPRIVTARAGDLRLSNYAREQLGLEPREG